MWHSSQLDNILNPIDQKNLNKSSSRLNNSLGPWIFLRRWRRARWKCKVWKQPKTFQNRASANIKSRLFYILTRTRKGRLSIKLINDNLWGASLDKDREYKNWKEDDKFWRYSSSPLQFKGSHYLHQKFPVNHLDIPIYHQKKKVSPYSWTTKMATVRAFNVWKEFK